MKQLLIAIGLWAAVAASAQPAGPHFLAEGDNLAQRLTAFALHEEVGEKDARVAQVADWLARAAKSTGEEDRAIAASCVRTAKFLLDGSRIKASPLDPLEALATLGKSGQSMSDGLMAYVAARKAAPDKTHAEAMAALRTAAK